LLRTSGMSDAPFGVTMVAGSGSCGVRGLVRRVVTAEVPDSSVDDPALETRG